MTLTKSDVTDLLDAIRAGGDIDVIRKGVELVLQALIDAEATEVIGAEAHERSGDRTNWRNGNQDRLLATPRKTSGGGPRGPPPPAFIDVDSWVHEDPEARVAVAREDHRSPEVRAVWVLVNERLDAPEVVPRGFGVRADLD